MKENEVINNLMKDPSIRRLGLKKDSVVSILKAYSDLALESLLENGNIELGNGLYIDIVKLTDRVHVLRGVPYNSSRKYKLKLTMDNTVYQKIEDYYDALQREIE